jgi:hypothetical protein
LLLHPFTLYGRSLLVSTLQKTCFFVQSAECLWFCLSGSLHSIPILMTHQLNGWSHACYFHSVHHSLCCSYECFPHCQARHGR